MWRCTNTCYLLLFIDFLLHGIRDGGRKSRVPKTEQCVEGDIIATCGMTAHAVLGLFLVGMGLKAAYYMPDKG